MRSALSSRAFFALSAACLLAGSLSVAAPQAAHAATAVAVQTRVLVVADGQPMVGAIADRLKTEGVPLTTVNLADPGRPVPTRAFLASADGATANFAGVVLPSDTAAGLSPDELASLAGHEADYGVREVDAYTWANPAVGLNYAADPGFVGPVDGLQATISARMSRPQTTTALPTRSPSPSPTVRPTATSGARTWMIQYDGAIDYGQRVDFYNLDGENTTAAQVARLKARGSRVICYINAGAWEPWRVDAGSFPAAVKGRAMDGWADERWLDVRRLDVLMPIMTRRIQACRAKGFDGIDPDNTDGYGNATRFGLTSADSLAYLNRLAAVAHSQEMTIGLKNTLNWSHSWPGRSTSRSTRSAWPTASAAPTPRCSR